MNTTDSRQRTVPVTWATRARTISLGSRMGFASTFATTGATGGLTVIFASASAITSAAGCIKVQWKSADTDGNGLLHGLASRSQKAGSVRDGEGAARGQRGIFTERMTGDKLYVARKV